MVWRKNTKGGGFARIVSHFAATAAALVATGCSELPPDPLTIEGLPYAFPKDHVHGFVPAEKGYLYLRLAPPGQELFLIIDARSERKQREQNSLVVSSINDTRFSQAKVFFQQGEQIVCKDTPLYSCGLQLNDSGITWSVVFHRESLSNVTDIKRRAEELITRYRKR